MTGTVLLFRDDGDRPLSQVALSNGDRIQLVLDGNGLAISWLRPSDSATELIFQGPAPLVAALCAGLVGPKRQSSASPLRILTAAVQSLASAHAVRAAFRHATEGLT
jgi:hypothetical protein